METTQPDKKELLTLILADMRNRRLILGLEATGLSSEDFYTDLANLILLKIGFPDPQDEEVYTWYENTIEYILEKDLSYFRNKQHDLAARMYNLLLLKKHSMYPFGQLKQGNRIVRLFKEIGKKRGW